MKTFILATRSGDKLLGSTALGKKSYSFEDQYLSIISTQLYNGSFCEEYFKIGNI